MSSSLTRETPGRVALSRETVVSTASTLADSLGLEATSMRRIAEELEVTPMALYKHIANREELVDAMVDRIVEAIPMPPETGEWRHRLRSLILSARAAVMVHPWAREAIETRSSASETVLRYMDALMQIMLEGGFSADLVHRSMHALSTRMWGFTRDVFPTPQLPNDPKEREEALREYARQYPSIVQMTSAVMAQGGCEPESEFAFSLDILLDGFAAAHSKELSDK